MPEVLKIPREGISDDADSIFVLLTCHPSAPGRGLNLEGILNLDSLSCPHHPANRGMLASKLCRS